MATSKAAPKKTTAEAAAKRADHARRSAQLLKQISDPTRLRIVLSLANGEKHVEALSEELGASQPTVSHHLSLLWHGGIIRTHHRDKFNFYALTDQGRRLLEILEKVMDIVERRGA